MRNRAKCKLCQSIIESFHATDLVLCKCGEIMVDGGESLRCCARDWNNFLRIDDLGNEIIPKIIDKTSSNKKEEAFYNEYKKPNSQDLLDMLSNMIKTYEELPSQAMQTHVTHYDLLSFMMLVSALFRSERD